MKHLRKFNESNDNNERYEELALILQSEVLDEYEIYKGYNLYDEVNGWSLEDNAYWEFIYTNKDNMSIDYMLIWCDAKDKKRSELYSDLVCIHDRVYQQLDINYTVSKQISYIQVWIIK